VSHTDYARRSRARTAINRLGGHGDVVDVTLIPAWEAPRGRPTVEIAIAGSAVPPVVARELGRAELAIREVTPRGGMVRVVAVAE